ncbi:MAG: RtcB family protein, partial [Planctomycetes bacterium]|nr:RtcB family protein [Planctomycetota bacterium]
VLNMQATYRQWGNDLDANSIQQMHNACELPISRYAALMPDAHLGYGLPIGGVLATDSAVIPYAVGVDIACRVKLSVLDLSATHPREALKNALLNETRFGMGSQFENPRDHHVMDMDWGVCGSGSSGGDWVHSDRTARLS